MLSLNIKIIKIIKIMKFFKLLTFVLSIIFFISCESNIELEEQEVGKSLLKLTNQSKTVNKYDIELKSFTIREKNIDKGFNARLSVGGKDRTDVKSVNIIFEEPYEGPAPLETEVYLEKLSENLTTYIFNSGSINFKNPELAIGKSYVFIIKLFDDKGNIIISERQKVIIEPSKKSNIKLKSFTIREKNIGKGFNARLSVGGKDRTDVKSVNIIFEEPYEGPAPDEAEVYLEKVSENITKDIFNSDSISFKNPELAIGKPYVFIINLLDEKGNIIISEKLKVVIESNKK
jgi:hypothetical protein